MVRLSGTWFIPTGLRLTENDLEGFELWSECGKDNGKLPFRSGEGNSRIGVPIACRNIVFFDVRVPYLLRRSSKIVQPLRFFVVGLPFVCYTRRRYMRVCMFMKIMIMASAILSVWT